jgi:hypothetical protein
MQYIFNRLKNYENGMYKITFINLLYFNRLTLHRINLNLLISHKNLSAISVDIT